MINNYGFGKDEIAVFKSLKNPAKIQDFIDSLPYNTELNGDTCYSPRNVLMHRTANCVEAAVFAAAAFRVTGYKPLIFDLTVTSRDDDHVIAVYKIDGFWGAIAKSKFTGLKFREPVYKNLRELAMSYFEDYFNEEGEKTLRGYSAKPVDLSIFDKKSWMTTGEHLWFIPEYLGKISHSKILTPKQVRNLRMVTELELKAGMLGYPKKLSF
ncbi:MAG: hypothetical protein M1536_00070 [Firmicutes bacterium]|nr:hypothetical protein [Bacillota bacterium]